MPVLTTAPSPFSLQVLAGAAGALRNLTVSDEIAKHIALAGGLEVLIAAAEAHLESAEVQSEAAGALWGLAITEEIAEAICTKGGIKVLATALVQAGAAHLDKHAALTTAPCPLPHRCSSRRASRTSTSLACSLVCRARCASCRPTRSTSMR